MYAFHDNIFLLEHKLKSLLFKADCNREKKIVSHPQLIRFKFLVGQHLLQGLPSACCLIYVCLQNYKLLRVCSVLLSVLFSADHVIGD